MKKNIVCLFIVFVLVSIGSLFAQTQAAPQELRIGSFASGNFTAGQEIWYSVRSAQAGVLSVETDSAVDTFLEAYDAQRNFLTSDDDGAGYPNARIRLITQANTTYLFKFRAFSNETSGSYRIFAESKPITELRSGSAVNGNITSGGEYIYNVRAGQNGYITVETSGDTDTYLTAYDEFYNYITEDDDGTGTINARIRIRVVSGKNYIFALRGYGPTTTGAFRIQANSQGYPAPTVINIGSFVNGNISYGDDLWYSVRATQTGHLTVETTSSANYDYYGDTHKLAYLEAYDDAYNILADDDGSMYPNNRIRMMVTAGKTYYFNLRGPDYDTSGAFRIFASFQPLPAPTTLAIGSFLSGNIESSGEYWYSIRPARSGKLIVETMGNTDTYLYAYDNLYVLITSNDDYVDQNARVEINATANQTYIIMLRGYSNYTTGPYRIFASIE